MCENRLQVYIVNSSWPVTLPPLGSHATVTRPLVAPHTVAPVHVPVGIRVIGKEKSAKRMRRPSTATS